MRKWCAVLSMAVVAGFGASGAPAAEQFEFGIGVCSASGGSQTVTAGVPLNVRAGGFITGSRGLFLSGVRAEASVLTLTDANGNVRPLTVVWDEPQEIAKGVWFGNRRTFLGPLVAGEMLRLDLVIAYSRPHMDVITPKADWDPQQFGFPAYDGIGLRYFEHIAAGPAFGGFRFSCTVTAV